MSSSPTEPTSTTASSTSSPSRAEGAGGSRPAQVALIACGAIAQPCGEIVASRGWSVEVFPLPPLLHNQPHLIADQVDQLAEELGARYPTVAIGYADCGTYGALDEVCERRRLR